MPHQSARIVFPLHGAVIPSLHCRSSLQNKLKYEVWMTPGKAEGECFFSCGDSEIFLRKVFWMQRMLYKRCHMGTKRSWRCAEGQQMSSSERNAGLRPIWYSLSNLFSPSLCPILNPSLDSKPSPSLVPHRTLDKRQLPVLGLWTSLEGLFDLYF